MITSCQKVVTSLPFFQFTANLEQSAQSVKLTFSLIVTFYLTKTESRNKISLTQLSHYSFEQRYYIGQKTLIFCKEMLTSAKLRESCYLKVYFSKLLKLYVCVLTCQILSFQHNSNEIQTEGVGSFTPHTQTPQNKPLKSPKVYVSIF